MRGTAAIFDQLSANKKNLILLIQLRWLAVAGQIVTVLAVQYVLGIALPLPEIVVVLLFLAMLNSLSYLRYLSHSSISNTELFLELLLDVAALTVQLYLTGGAGNPFVFLFLLQVILGAVLLEAWSTWTLMAITTLCFAGLGVAYKPIALPSTAGGGLADLHIEGPLVCYGLVTGLLVFFVTRIIHNLRLRDARLADLRQRSAEEDLIVRMGLLASGAAHELGTPLSTVAVIVSDWKRLPMVREDPDLAQDIAEMQRQLDRCKAIVTGILMSAGEARGDSTLWTTVCTFFDGLATEWQASRAPLRLDYANSFGPDMAMLSNSALKQIVFNLFENAFEASPQWVGAELSRRGNLLQLQVSDAGPGFEPRILDNFGKPYHSGKAGPGRGLGLFLVVNVVRKLGGTAEAANRAQGGAEVTITLPLQSLSPGEAA